MFGKEQFIIGCNYWASHAGTDMWRDWRPEVVEEDFARLESLQLQVVRIFPLWPDFQPLQMLYAAGNTPREVAWPGGRTIPPEADGRITGVDPEMLKRFGFVCDCAQRHQLQLGVGLVTGWMSGRLFAPPAFADRDLLTAPEVLRWQRKFVHRLVSEFCDHPAIAFWGPGNECNCMGAADRHQAYAWSCAIADTIRLADRRKRPIAAGLHGLTAAPATEGGKAGGSWTIQDMAEIFDALTTHPYPVFTAHAQIEGLTGLKNLLHAVAESRFYGDVGHRPCLVEEFGTLSPMVACGEDAAIYLRNTLWHLWSHDCEGLLWWCAFDQSNLRHAPYRWCAVERELGLIRNDGSVKPVGQEMQRFIAQLQTLPFSRLPRFRRNAVCVLSEGQDCWRAAWGAWILAKQAGFDLEFQYAAESLRSAELYLVPSLSGLTALPGELQEALFTRAAAGATVYFSHDDALLSPFESAFGLRSHGRFAAAAAVTMEFESQSYTFDSRCRLRLEATTAEVLGRDPEGNALFTRNRYGLGTLYFLSVPVENQLVNTSLAWQQPYWQIYARVAETVLNKRCLSSTTPKVTLSEHPLTDDSLIVVAVNNSSRVQNFSTLVPHPEWRIRGIEGDGKTGIAPHDGAILYLVRQENDEVTT